MKIYLFLQDKVLNFTLSQDISGSFSFDENSNEESKLINIEARNGKWYLYSTGDVSVVSNNCIYREMEVINNTFYYLRRNDIDYLIYICSIENNHYDIYNYDNRLSLIIGNSADCNLKYPLGNGIIASILLKEKYFVLSQKGNASIYINNSLLKNQEYILKYGDSIMIYSLRIIFLNKIILINNPSSKDYLLSTAGAVIRNGFYTPAQDIEVKDRSLYTKDNYFSKSPRIRRFIEEKNIKLLIPSSGNGKDEDAPFILTIGPMITMALISVATFGSSISKIFSEETTIGEQLPSLISAIAMFLTILVWPLIIRNYTKRSNIKKARVQLDKYQRYLNTKHQELATEYKTQKEIILENLISCSECIKIIQRRGYNFWAKRNDQDDFLLVRIGTGKTPFKVNVEYPEESFGIEENEFRKQADNLIQQYKYINDVPIGYSLLENHITAIMGNFNKSHGFVHNIILQLITFYNYEDVKIVIFTNEDNSKNWDYVKYLNHNFNNNRSFRFFASNVDSGKTVSDFLSNELSNRIHNKCEFPKPHYIIITDSCEMIKNYNFFKDITENDSHLGFSCLMIENQLSKLPSKCNNFITLGADNNSGILKNSYEKQEQIYFNDEVDYSINMMAVSKIVSNIPIELEEGISRLPESISFLEMERVGKVEQLNILSRWNINDSTASLKAEIGVDSQENLMYLDLHEKVHGPHGLIAGTTGSGKSEFIITYILSMCINYSPDDVSFILIDYKGGGLALAFENKVAGMILPHLAGTITNLDKAEMDRTLVSIDSEVKRRQKLFNEAREILGESTMDIYKYQRFYHDGKLNEALPHLFIICDEFAELKNQQPDFMDNLVSVARIGRSLGVHLILATQKPTGVVDDQIWSNSRFKVCLRVQDESDSREMLKKSDAVHLKQVGRFYLQVGYDEYYALGQSGWCGAKYYPSDKIVKQVDKSVNIINDCGLVIKDIQTISQEKKLAQADQLSAILADIIESANRVNKFSRKLWLDNVPENILINDLYKKYKFTSNKAEFKALIGEYDAPEKQEQGAVIYDLLEDGNTIIYGNDGSERELLLNAIVYSIIMHYPSDLINFYAIDYGSEFLNKYLNSKHFGGVVTAGEEEEFNNLFKLIKRTINKRKKLFSDMGVDFKLYNNKLPLMVVILNNYDSIYDNNQSIYDDLPDLVRDSERYGVVYIFTCNSINSIHNKISSNCKNFYSFRLKDTSDYNSVFGTNSKILLRDIFGRGLINNNGVHEFQTAKIMNNDSEFNAYISNIITKANQYSSIQASKIPLLPEIVRFNDISGEEYNLTNVPIGIGKEELDIIRYDFTNNIGNIFTTNKLKNIESFIKSLLLVLHRINNLNIYILDPLNLINLNNKLFPNHFTDNFDNFINKIIEITEKLISSKNTNFKGIILIYGLNKFMKTINSNQMDRLVEALKKCEQLTLIIVDEVSKIKNYAFDSWFTSTVNLNDGIWLGKGISDQNLLRLSTINKNMAVELEQNMGYYVSEGSVKLSKFIDFFKEGNEDGK